MMLAIISGAGKGIGKSIALALAKEGFDLALGSRSMEDLKQVKEEIAQASASSRVFIKTCDFSDKDEIARFSKTVKELNLPVEVIVNNVGAYTEGTASEEEEGILEKMLNTNLYSAYYLTRAFAGGMKQKRKGHIFNICSIASKQPRKEAAAYTISKYAMYGFHKVLCEEMKSYHVKVTALLPGPVNTSSWDGTAIDGSKLVQPEDIARLVVNAYRTSASALTEEIIINPLNF